MSLPAYSFLPSWPLAPMPLAWIATLLLAALVAGEVVQRQLRLPRIIGYLLVGAVLGPNATSMLDAESLPVLRIFADIGVGLLLFELGQRVDLGWLLRNPSLLVISLLEAVLTSGAVYAVMRLFDLAPVVSAAAAVLAVATAPAVVVTLVKDLRAQGQVTERVLLFTALNTTYSVVGLALIFGWLHYESASPWTVMLAHPLYLIAGALFVAASLSAVMVFLLRLFGRRPGFQFSITVALVLLAVAAASALGLLVPLTLLLLGLLARLFDRERHFISLRFDQTAMLFIVLLFALAGASLRFEAWWSALPLALAFICARYLAKLLPFLLLAGPSSLSMRKASLVSLGLTPMSGLSLLMAQDLSRQAPVVVHEMLTSVYLAIAVLAIVGPIALQYALHQAGEVGERTR